MNVPDDKGESFDEGIGDTQEGSEMSSEVNQEDYTSPIIQLKYALASVHYNLTNRLLVGRVALQTLRVVADTPEDVRAAMEIISRAATDTEMSIGAELMEDLPRIAMICHEEKDKLHFVIEEYILPLVIKLLGDADNQVRKSTQAALLVLMEQRLIDMKDVEEKVCPMILTLTEMDNIAEFNTGGIALMTKVARFLGSEATKRLFLPRFATLCSDPLFHVRKACANNFGDFCAALGTAATEEFLLPYFVALCADVIWGVRKACAEAFTTVSLHCTLQTRKDTLAPVFSNLLLDHSRWVKMSAFHALGQFIATFINSEPSNIHLHQQCELANQEHPRLHSCDHLSRNTSEEVRKLLIWDQTYYLKGPMPIVHKPNLADLAECDIYVIGSGSSSEDNTNTHSNVHSPCSWDKDKSSDSVALNRYSRVNVNSVATCDSDFVEENQVMHSDKLHVYADGVDSDITPQDFNTFQFWRVPIPEVELYDTIEQDNASVMLSRVSDDNQSDSFQETMRALNKKIDSLLPLWGQCRLVLCENVCSAQISSTNMPVHTDDHDSNKMSACNNSPEATGVSHSEGSMSEPNSSEFQDYECSAHENSRAFQENFGQIGFTESSERSKRGTCEEKCDEKTEAFCSELTDLIKNSPGKCTPPTNLSQTVFTESSERSRRRRTCEEKCDEKTEAFCSELTDLIKFSPEKCSSPTNKAYDRNAMRERMNILDLDRLIEPENISPYTLGNHLIQPDIHSSRPVQSVVPHYLVDHFVSMTHPSQSQNTDNDITHHCAFSIPAVALTLGRSNWHFIKPAYEALASDTLWKVRRTVAASIHELAVILGEELAGSDLLPVFHGFIKDVDEVRIGALKHLADFLKLLRPTQRRSLLFRLSDFNLTDNECNWRFRHELAEQLRQCLVLFTPEDTHEHITPLSISLLMDKVAAVRREALSLVTHLVHHVSTEVHLVRNLLAELAEQFAHNKHWNRRQTYALLCSEFMSNHVLKDEHFACDVFPHLLDLSWDLVPNVRLAVARTLACDIAVQSYFSSPESPHNEMLIQCLRRLQNDDDKDVQYFASLYSICKSPVHFEDSSNEENLES